MRNYSQGMQDIDRVDDVQSLALPTWSSRVCVQAESLGFVQCAQELHGRIGILWRWRNVRQDPPVRPAELKLAVWQSLTLVAFLMNGAVVATAQEREVGEDGGPTVRPVANMMPLAEPHEAAGEPAAAVSML